jgi:membrane protein
MKALSRDMPALFPAGEAKSSRCAFIAGNREHAFLTQSVDPTGRDADRPTALPLSAWRDIGARVWTKTGTDNIGLLAAGVAFFSFLALVPLIGALVMIYGLIADPGDITDHVRLVVSLVPHAAAQLIIDQIVSLVTTPPAKKGLGLIVALIVSLYGASRASGALIAALNIIYEQPERRGLVETTALALVLVAGAVVIAVLGLLGASALAFVGKLMASLGVTIGLAVSIATWAITALLTSAGIAAAYRYAPDRHHARWRWLGIGAGLATLLWLLATIGFGLYARTLGNYNATYGSLSAVVVLLMWLWVSAYAILLGAEVNAEAERQTSRDTTVGPERPPGERGATVADHSAGDDGSHPSEGKSQAAFRQAAPRPQAARNTSRNASP